jgi:hypothetical protein
MIVANAECPVCLAKYLAWMNNIPHRGIFLNSENAEFEQPSDLSFRHSFNDEPNERDLPVYDVKIVYLRTGLFSKTNYTNLGIVDSDGKRVK